MHCIFLLSKFAWNYYSHCLWPKILTCFRNHEWESWSWYSLYLTIEKMRLITDVKPTLVDPWKRESKQQRSNECFIICKGMFYHLQRNFCNNSIIPFYYPKIKLRRKNVFISELHVFSPQTRSAMTCSIIRYNKPTSTGREKDKI